MLFHVTPRNCYRGKCSGVYRLILSHLPLSFWLGFTCNRYSRPKIGSSDLQNQIRSGLQTFVLFSIRFAGVLRLSSGSGMSSSGGFRHPFLLCRGLVTRVSGSGTCRRPIVQVPRSPRGTLALIEAIREMATNHRI